VSASALDIEAFILIGGKSSRFGSDKAFAAFGPETLAARAVRTVKVGLSPLRTALVVSRGDQFTSQTLDSLGCSVVIDRRPGLGAWSGIDAAITNAQSEWVLVLACDLPFVSVGFLRLLADRMNDEFDAVVSLQPDGRLQPLCALYRVRPAQIALATFLKNPNLLPPVSAVFEKLRTFIVVAEEYNELANAENLFLNINTHADLTAATELEYHQSSDT